MAVLTTPTGTHVFSADEPYIIERVKQRYYFIAELVTDGGQEFIRVSIYDAVAKVDVVPPRVVSDTEASTLWQTWYGVLAT